MKHTVLALLTLGLLVASRPASAQLDLSAGTHVGTLGIGADFALALNERIAVRTGGAFAGLNLPVTGLFGVEEGRTATLEVPKGSFRIGADFLLGGGPRLGAGLLLWSENPLYEETLDSGATIDLGGTRYTQAEVNQVLWSIQPNVRSPYVMLGFGSPTGKGFKVLLDFGVVMLGDTSLEPSARGDDQLIASPDFRRNLEAEALSSEQDLGWKLSYWPIFSLGFRYGF